MMKKLGFGMMRLPLTDANVSSSIDLELTKKMVDAFLEKGFTYFDTAWMYCGEKSECAVREALVSRHPRERFTLTTKLPHYLLHKPEDCDKVFDQQREKTGVDYFDYYLIHNVNAQTIDTFEQNGAFDWLVEKKRAGLVKTIGFSFHDGPELLEKVLTAHPEMELVQLQLNYLDWESLGVQSRKCHEVAVRHGKRIIVMEPVKGGILANVPEAAKRLFVAERPEMSVASWAIRFAASQSNVMMVLSGMGNMEMMVDNMSYMNDFVPLSEEESAVVAKVAEMINSEKNIPCTGCSYCTVHCPEDIAIPKYFSLYNNDLRELHADSGWTPQKEYYMNQKKMSGSPKECVFCGQCEKLCPQHLPIRKLLQEVKFRFE